MIAKKPNICFLALMGILSILLWSGLLLHPSYADDKPIIQKSDKHLVKDSSNSLAKLYQGNKAYIGASFNSSDISKIKRLDTKNEQKPYAIVVTCSDSRVVPEHIFNAGIGELFVLRNAGNVILDIELGSIEYGADFLKADKIIVMGHTNCGAVGAAIKGNVHGKVKKITDIIKTAIGSETDPTKATIANIKYSIAQIMTSPSIQKLVKENKVSIRGAFYNLKTGQVEFF